MRVSLRQNWLQRRQHQWELRPGLLNAFIDPDIWVEAKIAWVSPGFPRVPPGFPRGRSTPKSDLINGKSVPESPSLQILPRISEKKKKFLAGIRPVLPRGGSTPKFDLTNEKSVLANSLIHIFQITEKNNKLLAGIPSGSPRGKSPKSNQIKERPNNLKIQIMVEVLEAKSER